MQLVQIMAESSLVESVPRVAPSSPAGHTKPEGYSSTHLQRSSQEAATPPPPATTRMAYVVNSIKEGFRKLGGGRGLASDGYHARTGRRRSPFINHGQITENLAPDGGKYARREGGNLWGVKRKVKGGEREVSFEMYLSSLPKADPVDRTVHWLFHHHDDEVGSRDHEGHRERNIASIRGDVIGRQLHTALRQTTHLKVLQPVSRPGTPSWQQAGESSPYDTSLSYYESARGTGGRGTPPPRAQGQPRLDDLFRQLQVEREREARIKTQAKEDEKHQQHQLATNSSQLPGYMAANKVVPGYSAGMRHDLTSQQPPFVLHKHSTHYNQGHTHQCEWGHCRMKFLSSKDVLTHIQDQHMSYLPATVRNRPIRSSQRLLVCEWRGCENRGRGYVARYKLLMHIKTAHVLSQQRRSDSHSTYWKYSQK